MKKSLIDFTWEKNRVDLINVITVFSIIVAVNYLGAGLAEDIVIGAIIGSIVHFTLTRMLPK
jgi:hypothetical protein